MTKPNQNSEALEQLAFIDEREEQEIHQLENLEDFLF